MRFLRTFMQTHTVIFVSHDTASVKSLCSSVLWLEKGQLFESGTPKEVCDLYLQAFYEAQQGKSTKTTIKREYQQTDSRVKRDQRLDVLNQSNLRNELQIFDFDPNAASFGKSGATITNVTLEDTNRNPMSWVVGGEEVHLCITAIANQALSSPIIGFFIKDKLGQFLFGDNTYITTIDQPLETLPQQSIVAEFNFIMPRLSKGDYSIGAAIADGTQETHEQHHWIHDAVVFKSESGSLSGGLIGMPMHNVKLQYI
jgi:lipopolysaccharide transport system ATP-binding protein